MKKTYIKPTSEMMMVYSNEPMLRGSFLENDAQGNIQTPAGMRDSDVDPERDWGFKFAGDQGDDDWHFAKQVDSWFDEG